MTYPNTSSYGFEILRALRVTPIFIAGDEEKQAKTDIETALEVEWNRELSVPMIII